MPPRKPPSARAAAAAARPKSQYKQIDKRKYDRRALDLADDAERTRGRVHASDAARVWHDVHDGGRVTDIEYATLARIAMDGMYKMTRGVTTFFRDKVSAHRRWRTLRRTVEFVALAKAGARRHRRNEDEDEFENERERERGGWEPTSTPARAARAAWQRILPALLALLATRAIVTATAATGSPPRAVAGAAAAAAAAAVLVPALIATWALEFIRLSPWSPVRLPPGSLAARVCDVVLVADERERVHGLARWTLAAWLACVAFPADCAVAAVAISGSMKCLFGGDEGGASRNRRLAVACVAFAITWALHGAVFVGMPRSPPIPPQPLPPAPPPASFADAVATSACMLVAASVGAAASMTSGTTGVGGVARNAGMVIETPGAWALAAVSGVVAAAAAAGADEAAATVRNSRSMRSVVRDAASRDAVAPLVIAGVAYVSRGVVLGWA
ncbi:uncharacterized protein MICPUCDRAFT_59654 [Micromonas pusilla CCMP1545]|uniref:Predicted protein n=1 Tax=Micromonas pusilla (strain CCMP1545) TaxID=564608 RepID=C1MW77_MICPC|nr:uncharacterized protein MICPUCDRAFT_59654 [Micromonas pusilla CCMP1545]EEH55827.1 predicted protein [Micromonas pusilla CCMP1545]|eukprot:XP_003059875.1 predicted protein [Micromonas pusilla CCMP1545]